MACLLHPVPVVAHALSAHRVDAPGGQAIIRDLGLNGGRSWVEALTDLLLRY